MLLLQLDKFGTAKSSGAHQFQLALPNSKQLELKYVIPRCLDLKVRLVPLRFRIMNSLRNQLTSLTSSDSELQAVLLGLVLGKFDHIDLETHL